MVVLHSPDNQSIKNNYTQIGIDLIEIFQSLSKVMILKFLMFSVIFHGFDNVVELFYLLHP